MNWYWTSLIVFLAYAVYVGWRFPSSWVEGKGAKVSYRDKVLNWIALPGFRAFLYLGVWAVLAINWLGKKKDADVYY